ncbi:hypothetical protein QU38_02620, partial [Staphylococcus aureus]
DVGDPFHRIPAAARGSRGRAFQQVLRQHVPQGDHHGVAVHCLRALLADLPSVSRRQCRADDLAGVHLDAERFDAGRLGAARRQPDRGDARGGDQRLGARPPL